MEERLSWIWTKTSENMMGTTSHAQASIINPIFGDSWEEQAFAEDASRGLGGCIWPPRSYSCSFCRREFRSAQALGGHMNVHRRDRARLKQLPSPHTHEILSYGHDLEVNKPIFSHVHQYPSWVGTELYNSKAQEQYEDDGVVVGLPMSTSSSILEEHQKKPSILLSSWSNLSNNDENSKVLDLETRTKKGDCDDETIDLSINLNMVDKSRFSSSPGGEEKEFVALKRRRIESSLIIPKPTLDGYKCSESEGLEDSPGLMEGLDLELRLGDPPKVK